MNRLLSLITARSFSWCKRYITTDFFKLTILPLILVFINLVLKLRHFGVQSIAGDEPFSIYMSQFDVPSIISYLSHGNNPPLFEIILHYWVKMFGIGVASVRFLPCLFSALTVWFIYKIGTNFYNYKTGVLSAIFFTLSNYQIYFAHETRVYSLFLLLTCISFYAYMHLINKPDLKFRIIHAVILILLPYAHYFGFFVLFTQLMIALVVKEVRVKILKIYLINLLVGLVTYIPFVFIFIKRLLDSAMHGTWVQPVRNLGQLHDVLRFLINDSITNYLVFILFVWFIIQKFFQAAINKIYLRYAASLISIFFLFYAISIMGPMPYYWEFTSKPVPMASYLLFVVVLLSLSLLTRTISVYTKVLLAWFLIPLLIMFVSSFWIPMFLDRYWIFITGSFYILTGIGVYYLEEFKSLGIGLLLVALIGITFQTNVDNKRHAQDVIQKVKELKTQNSIVYICVDYFDINFAYYYSRKIFKDIGNPETKTKLHKELASENVYPIHSFRQLDTVLLRKADKVIYIDAAADFAYPGNHIKAYLDSCMQLTQDYFYYEIYHVIEYKPKSNGTK
jgi:mannosyltransferase